MGTKSKLQSLGFIVLLLAASAVSLTIKPADAQEVPQPAVPQFSIRYVDYSYEIPAYTSTDSFTGEQIQHPSQHIGDIRIEGKIKNQPFTRYDTTNAPNGSISNSVDFYYNVRSKGHFGTDWTNIYGYHNKDFIRQYYDSEYTNFTIYLQEFPEGHQVDYQVQALIGYEGRTYIGPYPQPIINGEESDWSSTLTLVFTKNESSVTFASNIDNSPYSSLPVYSTAPTPTPTVPESSLPIVLCLFAVMPIIAVITLKKKEIH